MFGTERGKPLMFIKYLFMSFFALSGGMIVSGGVFTVLVAVGLIPRFADKTHTAKHILLYEDMVIWGTITGCFFSVFSSWGQIGHLIKNSIIMNSTLWDNIGNGILIIIGFFSGMFVGCLALAIAEMLDTIPIFARRIGFKKGLGIAVLCVAIGKMLGSLLYFANGFYVGG